jgi:hypothetical protein
MIANNIIISITVFFLLLFAFSTLLLYFKCPKNRGIKLFGIYFILVSIGLVLTSLRNKIPDFISLQIGVSIFSVAYMYLYLGLKDILGQDSKWRNRYFIPIIVLFIGIFMFTYIQYNLHMRIIIFSFYIAIYAFITSWLFYKASAIKFKTINLISSMSYTIIAFVFLIRGLNSTTMSSQTGIKDFMMFIVNSPYISLCCMSILLIIISNIYLRAKM